MVGQYSFCHSFLDELPEFDERSLEAMRRPLEDHIVTISRASGTLTFPANFQLIAAMNQLGMSARAFHRVLKLARTIADLAGAERIQAAHP